MPPKRKAPSETLETPQPTRKSARIINREPLAGASARAMSVETGLSALSTDVKPPETWPDLCRKAKERIDRYEAAVDDSTSPKDKAKGKGYEKTKRADQKLKACIIVLLDWLPAGGRDSAARDILQCETDDKLYEMFENICICLLAPLKTAGSNSAFRTSIDKREENSIEPPGKLNQVLHIISAKYGKLFTGISLQSDML
ncbi:hypothetical protein DTO164E3_7843 [Paecilomyces variotii]|nr:hypothetical protein DTO164E3_7843 [Paecilomyces variotii]